MILTLEVKKLLHKGYKAYLVHVVDMSTPEVTLRNVLVLRILLDVFSEDLLGLPLD